MRIAGRYSFNGGAEAVHRRYSALLREIESVIASVDAQTCRTKTSKETTMLGCLLYSPRALNKAFKDAFRRYGWRTERVQCDYRMEYYTDADYPSSKHRGAFREMDFIKSRLGVEVQFGKYAFMVYNVCAKMTIFGNLGFIDTGVEIVPIKAFADEMSTGVSYFEQFTWDLDKRGVSNIDIPVLILGIAA